MTDSEVFDKLQCGRTIVPGSVDCIASYRIISSVEAGQSNSDRPVTICTGWLLNSADTSKVAKASGSSVAHETVHPMPNWDDTTSCRVSSCERIGRPPGSTPGRSARHCGEQLAIASYKSCPDFNVVQRCPSVTFLSTDVTEQNPSSGSGSLSLSSTPSPPTTPRANSTHLTVPDIFTTSFTHSDGGAARPKSKGAVKERALHKQRFSEPNLAEAVPENQQLVKRTLEKSLSDCQHGPRCGPNEPRLLRLTDYLYIGNLEAMYHRQMLCRSKIASIVDLTNVSPEDVSRRQKNEIPCSCSSPVQHSPVMLRIRVRESDLVDIKAHFSKINKFIEGARENGKRALVACSKGDSLSVLVVVQYLMHCQQLSYSSALNVVLQADHNITLNNAYRELLRSVERQLVASGQIRKDRGAAASRRALSACTLRREAWTGY